MDLKQSLERRSQCLQAEFEDLLESKNVYYNPPASVHLSYDAIVFKRARLESTYANNLPYTQAERYEVTTITEDPDAPIIQKISRLAMCAHDRAFVSDNLYHNVFVLYR